MKIHLPDTHSLAGILNNMEVRLISIAGPPGFVRVSIPELSGLANFLGEGGNELFIEPKHLEGYETHTLH